MKRVIIFSLLCLLILTGCNNTNIEKKKNDVKKEKSNVDYNSLYYDKLNERDKEFHNSSEWVDLENTKYYLFDIDNNNLPELLVFFKGSCSSCKRMEFYTIENNKVVELNSYEGYEAIYMKNENYYIFHFGQGYGVFQQLNLKNNKLSLKEVASMSGTFQPTTYKNENLYNEIGEVSNKIELKDISEFKVNEKVTKKEKKTEEIVQNILQFDKIYYDSTKDYDKESTPVSDETAYYIESFSPGPIYYIFYEDGTLKYNASLCSHYSVNDGTYKIVDNKYIIISIPSLSSFYGENFNWKLEIISKDNLKNVGDVAQVCGFAEDFIVKE